MGGSSSKPKVTSRDRAVLELKVQRDRLRQYQKRIALVLDREVEIAREHLKSGHKDKALLALQKKKYQEQLLQKTNGQLLNLEQMASSIEFAEVELAVFNGLRQGNDVLGEIQKEMSMDSVEQLMADTAEAIAYQNEISAMLAGKLTEEDQEDLLGELDDIIQEIADEQTVELPSVPASVPIVVQQDGICSASSEDAEPEEEKVRAVAMA